MDITYKLVSDWNLKTDYSSSTDTMGIVTIASDPLFSISSSAGSYGIFVDLSDIRHGVFSKSSVYTLHYFTYANDVLSLEKIEVDGQEIKGINPQLVIKQDGNPVIIYYDLNYLAVSALEKNSGVWSMTQISYINVNIPTNKRQISAVGSGNTIHASCVYKFDDEQSVVEYLYYNGTSWTSTVVSADDENHRFSSTSIVLNSSDIPYIFVGTSSGISVYEKIRGQWRLERSYSQNSAVCEIKVVHDTVEHFSHIAYLCGTEARYQKYDHNVSGIFERFLSEYKFIDFNCSSVSIDINSERHPLISYSHIEEDLPIRTFLKIARSTDYGETFKTHNVSESSITSYVGYFSDIVFDNNDKICIIYNNDGVKMYDEQKDIDEDNISQSYWKDRRFLNNLLASDDPPTRDADGTFMEFTASGEQCFYLPHSSCTDLDESSTAFSILFSIIPKGVITSAQTIVSKSSDEAGYEIFLGGSDGLSLGFRLNTIYGSLETLVAELPVNEQTKIGFVYSGYDVKIYIKKPQDEYFTVYKYDICGDIKKTQNPFVIGAYGVRHPGSVQPYYPVPADTYTFSNFLDAKLTGLKYWKRELNYFETSYSDVDLVSYDNSIDPYSDSIDYNTIKSSSGSRYFVTHGDDLGVIDYGGIDKINLMSYSNFGAEDRITNTASDSTDPYIIKKNLGGMSLLWADKQTGYSEIYINNFDSNHATNYLSNANSRIRTSGRNARIVKDTNLFSDPKADFIKSGVFIGDFLSITSGPNYVGRRVPIVGVLSATCIEVGAYFSTSETEVGYYIDSLDSYESSNVPVKITSLSQTSISPVAVCDSTNDIHVVFQSLIGEYYDIYYQRYRSSNSSNQLWGSVKLTSKTGNSVKPSLAIDSNDVLHVVWEDTRNKSHTIMYGRSSTSVSSGNENFVTWTTSNLNGKDIVISGDLYSEDPHVMVDNDDVVHIIFAARINSSDDSIYEIYYCNNQYGVFTSPIRISEFSKKSRNPIMVVDKLMNRYVFFSCKQLANEEIYMSKYDYAKREWNLPKRISFSDADSVTPSVCIDSDGIIYIYWVDKTSSSNSVGFAKYDSFVDVVSPSTIRPSSAPSNVIKLRAAIDETKTIYLAWEDSRLGINSGTEIYKNEVVNLVNFDKISTISSQEQKTDAEIISEQLNKFVIGKRYSDDVSPAELPPSEEALGDIIVTLETSSVSYSVPMDVFNYENPLADREVIIMNSRDITIKIKGLPKTLAYRLKNIDDPDATYSEFFEFDIDIFPDTTIANWRLSSGNGAKKLGIELYTFHGLVSPITIDLYVNEPDLYDIYLYNDNGDSIGETVNTEYGNVKVLSFNPYWVKIKPHRVVDKTQSVKFDIIAQGSDILDNETVFDGEYYVGKFSVNPHDGIRYIDGNAKIVPRIESN